MLFLNVHTRNGRDKVGKGGALGKLNSVTGCYILPIEVVSQKLQKFQVDASFHDMKIIYINIEIKYGIQRDWYLFKSIK